MANDPYSRNTFEDFSKIRHYVSVRIKQGVPLVDADLNEAEDLRRYELRSFLRWFVGDGIPDHNDGFRILPSPDANEVIIAGGDGTPEHGGRCLVDGLEVLNESDVRFSDQEFADPDAAAAAGVTPVMPPTTPATGTRTDIYFLDVWEREITGDQTGHGDIVDARIGIETARRIRREWAVRVVDEDTGAPSDDDPAGHRYYPLASVLRTAGEDVIPASSIIDLRRRRVTLQSGVNFDQVSRDSFGSTYTLDDDGAPNLAASLREIINAMLRSGRAAAIGPQVVLTTDGPHSFPSAAVDAAGNLWLFWIRGTNEIWVTHQVAGSAWTQPALHRTLGGVTSGVAAVGASDGTIWLFWSDRIAPNRFDIRGQVFRGGVWEPEFNVNAGGANIFAQQLSAGVNSTNEVMIVWREQTATGTTFQSRRYTGDPANAQAIVALSNQFQAAPVVVVLNDQFQVYGAETQAVPATLRVSTWQPATSTWSPPNPVGQIPAGTVELAAVADRFGGVWLLYAGGQASFTGSYLRTGFSPDPAVLLELSEAPRFPSAVRDAQGNLRVYYRPGTGTELHQLLLLSEV
jgi:hypothetical protein